MCKYLHPHIYKRVQSHCDEVHSKDVKKNRGVWVTNWFNGGCVSYVPVELRVDFWLNTKNDSNRIIYTYVSMY